MLCTGFGQRSYSGVLGMIFDTGMGGLMSIIAFQMALGGGPVKVGVGGIFTVCLLLIQLWQR